ncbi:Dabb family protein [Bacillus sp. 3255]|uniref:Dabb family protein n=1 Tax=Bacillus sp. 3255 TaxID=2817904 RepID=UPI002859849E|nr:Dabb family protein [Bacillus sp. 3255]MDR6884628.1 hypothetical protein [Bacillus sp. 3255]
MDKVGSSMGLLGSIKAQVHLRDILFSSGISSQLLPGNEAYIGLVHEKLNEKGDRTYEPTIKYLDLVVPIEAVAKRTIFRNLGGSKMFEHIVLLKFKPDVSIEVKERAVMRAHDFKGKIPGIVDLSAGINMTEEIDHAQGFTLGIRVTFEDQQACRNYVQHPLHQNLLQSIGPFVEGVAVVDYPFA